MNNEHNKCGDKYGEETVETIRSIYVLGIIIWILVIILLELYNTDYIGGLILIIPIIFFIISMVSISSCEPDIDGEMFKYDVFLFGGAVIAILIGYESSEYATYFYKLLFVGVLFASLGIIDAWAPKKHLFIFKNLKTIFQTISTFIFVYLFYTVYFVSLNKSISNQDPFVDFSN